MVLAAALAASRWSVAIDARSRPAAPGGAVPSAIISIAEDRFPLRLHHAPTTG